MKDDLLQKTGLAVSRLVQELMLFEVGDRIESISYYQGKLNVSRGTLQNAFQILKNSNAIKLKNRGHLGTYIEEINYGILQHYSSKMSFVGVMPLPYSKKYEGMATALYNVFNDMQMNFNLAYVRGSEARIEQVVNCTYDFAVCSKYSALEAIDTHHPISIVSNFGKNSYLSKHVLVLREKNKKALEKGMRIAIDSNSFDQYAITKRIIGDLEVELVEMFSHQIIQAIRLNKIDAGVWNLDEIIEKGYMSIHYVPILLDDINTSSEAVIIAREDNKFAENLIKRRVSVEYVNDVQNKVANGEIIPSY